MREEERECADERASLWMPFAEEARVERLFREEEERLRGRDGEGEVEVEVGADLSAVADAVAAEERLGRREMGVEELDLDFMLVFEAGGDGFRSIVLM